MTVTGMKGKKYILASTPFASGGEGDIYDVLDTEYAAKIYFSEALSIDLEKKLWVMVEEPPNESVMSQVAWPLDMVYGKDGRFCGFIMKKMDINSELGEVYKYPSALSISMAQKVYIAQNICVVMSEVHKAGYIFGDFNPRNIGLNLKTGLVCFLDTDTYHVKDPALGDTYRCNVCAPGYVAPELLQKCADFTAANPDAARDVYAHVPLPSFTVETDNFALAIHIFKLLMNGYTPFGGIVEGTSVSQSSPGVGDAAVRRDNYCFRPGYKAMSVAIPPLETLPEEIADLFTRAFIEGKGNPQIRPHAVMWHKALSRFERNLMQCSDDTMHQYDKKNEKCPLCEADRLYEDVISADYKPPSGQKSFSPLVPPPPMPSVLKPPSHKRTESGRKVRFYDTAIEKISEKLDRKTVYGILAGAALVVLIMFVISIWRGTEYVPELTPPPEHNLAQNDYETEGFIIPDPEPTEPPDGPITTPYADPPTQIEIPTDAGVTIRFPLDSPVYTINGSPRFGHSSPEFHNGRNMVSLRIIADIMNARIDWVAAAQTAILTTGNEILQIPVGVPLPDEMGTPALIEGSVFVPFRFASEIIGGDMHMSSGAIYILVDELPLPISPATVIRFTFDTTIYTIDGVPHRGQDIPFMLSGRSMLPLQTLADIMGADMEWDEEKREATFSYDDLVLEIPVGASLPDGMGIPVLSNDNIFVPFNYAAAILRAELHWYARTGAIYLFIEDE